MMAIQNSSKNIAKNFRKFLIALTAAGLPHTGLAQEVHDCDWRANSWNISEPWLENTRTFANGNVRLARLDTVEPAVGGFHLLILSPPYDELGNRQCKVISLAGTLGFANMWFDQLTASYDPATGLLFGLPVEIHDQAVGTPLPAYLGVQLNQATGEIHTGFGG